MIEDAFKRVSPNIQLLQARGNTGTWTILLTDVANISFRPHVVEENNVAPWVELKCLQKAKEFCRQERRIQLLEASVGMLHDHAYAESFIEATMLCAALDRGSRSLLPYNTILDRAGFHEQRREKSSVWQRTIKSGTVELSIAEGDFSDQQHGVLQATYEGHGVNHWHNILRIEVDYEARGARRYVFWPEEAEDLRSIAANHLVDVLEKRMARERTRLSTPLGGKLSLS